jgi:hypothetical protein
LKKRSLLFLGLLTLLVFPIPTFLGLYFVEGTTPLEILDLDHFQWYPIALGLGFGILYALLALLLMQARVFKEMPTRVEKLVQSMNLTTLDCIFLSLCAGVGEELLFRSGVQFYLGPIITTVIFVAIHGYLNPFNWRMSLYGLIVLPFILVISFALEEYGLWFCIAAHFSYDFVLFYVMKTFPDEEEQNAIVYNFEEEIRAEYNTISEEESEDGLPSEPTDMEESEPDNQSPKPPSSEFGKDFPEH